MVSTLCLLNKFACFLLSFDFFLFKSELFENFFQIYHQSVNILNPDQARSFVGPELDPNCLLRLLAGNELIIIIIIIIIIITLCTLVNPKCVLWQTVHTAYILPE